MPENIHMPLDHFHPAVAAWFGRTFSAPTEPQRFAWPAIASGQHALIAAPTGSGKTLAAFLAAIDALVRRGISGQLEDATQVVYVSPLKALSNDIQRNLEQPLRGIAAGTRAARPAALEIRAQVRTGDTTQADRTAMRKRPPHILVTTPESLYLLLTSESGRTMLASDAHGDRRRNPRRRGQQARLSPGAVARAPAGAVRADACNASGFPPRRSPSKRSRGFS